MAYGYFEGDWLMTRLVSTLKITEGALEWSEEVLERLPEFINDNSQQVAQAVKLMIEGEKTTYQLHFWIPKLRIIFRKIKESNFPQAQKIAREAINVLGAKDGADLRDLL